MSISPTPWTPHDRWGRPNGKGDPVIKDALGEGPLMGQCSPFAYVVSDADGFVVAHCTNGLVTMSSDRSEDNAWLMAAAPELAEACQAALDMPDGVHVSEWNQVRDQLRAALAKIARDATTDATTDAPTDMDTEGDYWSEDSDYPLRDWRHEVADDNTRLGYWEWVRDRKEEHAEQSP